MSEFELINWGDIIENMTVTYKQNKAVECYYHCDTCGQHYLTEKVLFLEKEETRYWGKCQECKTRAFLKRVGFNKNYYEINPAYLENNTNDGTLKMIAKKYVSNLYNHGGRGLVICGSYGTYKTHFLSHIARLIFEFNERNPKMCKIHYFTIPNIIERYWQNRAGGHRYLSRLNVVMLDDFGGYLNEAQAALLDEIFEILYSNCVSTIITTNMKPEELETHPRCRRTIDLWEERNKRVVIFSDGFRGNKKNV